MNGAMGQVTANYIPDGDDWTVTVTADYARRSARAPGLIAARIAADQLIDQLAPNPHGRVVIHLLNGDGFAFSRAYLQARHGVPDTTAKQATAVAVGLPRQTRHITGLPRQRW